MIKLLPQNDTFVPDVTTPQKAIESLDKYSDRYNCPNLKIDIADMNILDAHRVATVYNTIHYLKYPNGNIIWKINSSLVEMFGLSFSLGNSSFELV